MKLKLSNTISWTHNNPVGQTRAARETGATDWHSNLLTVPTRSQAGLVFPLPLNSQEPPFETLTILENYGNIMICTVVSVLG